MAKSNSSSCDSGDSRSALCRGGKPSQALLFSGNVLADAESECGKLDKSLVDNNLGLEK